MREKPDFQPAAKPLSASLPEITGAVSYCDTVVLWCWRPLPEDLFRSLRTEYGPGRFIPGRLIERPGRRLGLGKRGPPIKRRLVKIHQPARHTLQQLKVLERRALVVNEVHIAVDLLTRSAEDADKLRLFLERHLVLTWRRSGEPSGVLGTTIYARRDGSAARNIAIYSDRPSKTGLGHCCHIELRFRAAQTCNRVGLGQLEAIVQGPASEQLLQRHTRLVFLKPDGVERMVNRMARRKIRLGATRTVAEISASIRRLLPRCIQEEPTTRYEEDSPRLLWNWRSQWRECLEQRDWASVMPLPTWRHWERADYPQQFSLSAASRCGH